MLSHRIRQIEISDCQPELSRGIHGDWVPCRTKQPVFYVDFGSLGADSSLATASHPRPVYKLDDRHKKWCVFHYLPVLTWYKS